MKVLKATVEWYLDYANTPVLEMLVDGIPKSVELIYEKRANVLYMAVLDGYVSFYAWVGPGNDKGFYSREFPLKLREGDEIKDVILKGPWSSRAGVMNNHFEQQVVDVHLTEEEESFNRGYTSLAGAATLELAQQAVDMIPDVELVKVLKRGDITYIPTYTGEFKSDADEYGIHKPGCKHCEYGGNCPNRGKPWIWCVWSEDDAEH